MIARFFSRNIVGERIVGVARPILLIAAIAIVAAPSLSGQVSSAGSQFNVGGSGLTAPGALALDGKGNLYIADSGNNRILGVPASADGLGTPVTVLSGLSSPAGVAADWSGNVYVADTGNGLVLKLPILSTGLGEAVVVGSGFSAPNGIAVDAWGNLYVSDSGNNRIVELPFSSGGYGLPVPVVSGLNNPSGVAVDAARTLYIADTGNNRVIKESLTATGYVFKQNVGYGLKAPKGVSVDKSYNVFIADTGNSRVLEELWFAAATRYNSQSTVGSNFNSPQAVGEDLGGRVYVADAAIDQVLEVVSTSNEFGAQTVGSLGSELTYNFSIAAGTSVGAVGIFTQGVIGQDFQDAGASTCLAQTYAVATVCGVNISFSPLGSGTRAGSVVLFDTLGNLLSAAFLNGIGLEPQAAYIPGVSTQLGSQLSGPAGVAVDGSGNLFIADTGNNRVVELPWTGSGYGAQFTVQVSGLLNPMGLTVDGAGNLYIVSNGNDKVLKLPWLGTGFGPQVKVGNGFYGPSDVAVDGGGNLYVTDTLDNVVVELPWAGNKFAAAQYLGSYHKFPGGLAVDGSGNVYFANPYMATVAEVPWAGSSFLPQRQLPIPGLSFPSALAVDGNSNLYVLDSVENQVVMLPWNGSAFGSPVLIAGGFNAPSGLAVDASGNLYVADTGNNQVVKIALSAPAPMSFANTYLGSTSADSAHTTLIENIGSQPLILSQVSYPNDFPQDSGASNPCGTETTVQPGSSCQLAADFTPQTEGSPLMEAVQIVSNSQGIAGVQQSVAVSGTSAGKLPQTLTFPGVPTAVYGTAPIALGAAVSSGLPIAYTVLSGPGVLSNRGATLSITGAGTIVVEAAQSGNAVYAAAAPVAISIVIAPAVLTVTPYNVNAPYGAVPTQFAYAISGLLPGEYVSQVVSGTATVTPGVAGALGSGTYTLTATPGTLSAANYTFAFASGTLTVSKAPLKVIALPSSNVYGAGVAALPWTLSGFVNGDGGAAITGAPAFWPASSVGMGVGSYAVTPSLGTLSSANYNFAFVPGKLTVTPAMLTVAVARQSITYGSAIPSPTYAVTGFMPGDTAAVALQGAPALVTAGSPQASAGTFAIAASLGTLRAANYIFTFVSGSLTVAKAGLTLAPNNATMVYGGSLPAFTYSLSGFVNGDTQAASCSGSPVVTTLATPRSVPGEFVIGAAMGSMVCANYSVNFGSGVLTVAKATLKVTALPASSVYGAGIANLTWMVSGFVNGDWVTAVTGAPVLSPATGAGSGVGSYTVTPALGTLSSANYNFIFISGKLTVTPAMLTVAVAKQSITYGSAIPAPGYTVSGLVPGDTAIGALQGVPALVTAGSPQTSAGTFAITASLGTLRAANYVFTFLPGSLTVSRAALSLVPNNATMVYGGSLPAFTFTATGFVNGDTQAASCTGSPALTTLATSHSVPGSFAISAAAGSMVCGNYSVNFGSAELTISKAVLTVKPRPGSMVYGEPVPQIAFDFLGFVDGDGASAVTGLPSFTAAATSASNAGSYAVSGTAGTLASSKYSFNLLSGALTVAKAPLTVAPSNVSMTYGGAWPKFSYTLQGLVNGDDASAVTGAPLYEAAVTHSSPVGSYVLKLGMGSLAAANYALTLSSAQLEVTKAVLTVAPISASMTYGGAVPALKYAFSGFVNGEGPSVVSGSPLLTTPAASTSGAGVYPVQLALGTLSAENYSFVAGEGQVTVNKAVLSVAPAAASMTYGGRIPVFAWTYSGFVNGDGAKAVTGAPAFRTSAPAAPGAGAYLVTASTGTLAAANYSFVFTTGLLTVNKAILTVAPANATMTYGGPVPAFGYAFTGFVNGDGAAVVSGRPAFKTAASSASPVGIYQVQSMAGSLSAANYTFASGGAQLAVGKAVLTVVPAAATMTYGAALPTPGYTLRGFVNQDAPSVVSGAPAIQTSATSASPAGTYAIEAATGSLTAANYSFATTSGTLTIQKALLTVTAVPAVMTYGGSLPVLSPVLNGFVNGDKSTVVSGAPSLTTAATSDSFAGTYPIQVGVGTLAAANYSFAAVNGALRVTPAVLTVTAGNQSMIYGSQVPSLTYVVAGFVNGDSAASALTGLPLLTTSATAKSPVGVYPVTSALGSLSAKNYTFQFVPGSVAIQKATLTVTAQNLSMKAGAAMPTLTYAMTGLLNGDTAASATTGAPSLTTSATSKSAAGSYSIVAAQGTLKATNYQFTLVNGTLTVTQ